MKEVSTSFHDKRNLSTVLTWTTLQRSLHWQVRSLETFPFSSRANSELTKCHCPVCGTTAVPIQLAVPDRCTCSSLR